MGRYFTLALQLPTAEPRVKNKKKVVMPKVNLGFFILAGLAVFGLLYLFEVNNISTKGYEIRVLEKRIVELRESTKRLELQAAEQKSIQNIEASVKTLNLVPGGGMNYIKDDGYALNQ